MHFQFDFLCSVTTYDITFATVFQYIVKYLFYGSHKNDVTSLIKVHRGYSPYKI